MDIRAIADWGRSNWRLSRLIIVLLIIALLLLGGAIGFIAFLYDDPFLAVKFNEPSQQKQIDLNW